MRHRFFGRFAGLAASSTALAVCMLAPGPAIGAAICDEQPITFGQTPAVVAPTVLEAPIQPLWRVVPPSSDPDAGERQVATFVQLRGIAVCGADQLVLVRAGASEPVVVRLPSGVSVASIPPGTELLAVGMARPDGGVDAVQLTILPDDQ